ncbi:hypothetical protein ABT390_22530 [Streptomyces aurantiacus]|uniref:Uncharacterized protein n=1 Tax=Streptomyces aurantiacus JA 4570 TaxID=1286094 RepID=S4A143_9ACTN|nr:hypothetical protein [Streptomyces aurantiacus]EPH44415.1 hypothetical protein STRAU_2547 [Streptomyces aurantiacus JA 4570]
MKRVAITPIRAQAPGSAADDGPIERDDDNPWKLQECRGAADPGKGELAGYTIYTSRYSLCTVIRTRYELKVGGALAAYSNFRVTILQDSHRRDRRTSIHLLLDDWDDVLVSGNHQHLRDLERSRLSVTLECNGSQGASCAGRPARERRSLLAWKGGNGLDDAFARFDMSRSRPTDPVRDARAKNFLRGDGVSFHAITATLDGALGEVEQSEQLRCDRAFYMAGSGGCVWDKTRLNWYVDYKDYPEYAKHVWDATHHPTTTKPFGSYPGVQIPGALDTRPNPKPLTRLHQSADGNASLTYRQENERIRTNACRRLSPKPGEECDEYPLGTTYEGANYTVLHPSDTWKYSVRFIDGDDNWNAGLDWRSWLARRRVLAKGDDLWVVPFNIPASEQRAGGAVSGRSKPGSAFLTDAERAGRALAPSELCTHPVMGGRYSCEYGEEWYTYSNGMKQMWVIGADRQVWTRWSRPNGTFVGWRPFGGVATSAVEVVWDDSKGMGAVIRVRGTDGKPHYRERNARTGRWNDWHLR